jgi:PAS domain S-box-containing protein
MVRNSIDKDEDELTEINEQFQREIAQREEAEKRVAHLNRVLRANEKRVQQYLDVAGIMLIAINADQQVTLINPKGCEVLGYPQEEVLGQNWFERFLSRENIADVKQVFGRIISGDIEPVEYFENPIVRKDGSQRFIAWHNSILRDPSGNIAGLFSSGEDITERKQVEEAIKVNLALQRVRNEILLMETEEDWGNVVLRLERELRSLIDFEDCGINVLDEKNDVQIDYYMKLDELQCEKVMGIPSVLRRVQEAGEPLYRRNREEIDRWENNRSRPEIRAVVDVPFPRGTLAVNSREEDAFGEREIRIFSQFAQVVAEGTRRLDDIIERNQMGQELVRLERLRAVGELSAGVSHNLNNILTNILGPAQLLQRKTDAPELLREVDDIITSARRARDLVHELHLSVRTEEEEMLKAVSVDPMVQQAVQTARPRWKDEPEAKGVAIEMVTQWGGVPPIQGTESGLHDIFTNLIFNAVDAMPEGGAIHIQTARVNDRVEVVFADTGTGMDEATRLRIFEPFFTTKMDIGTGLGLSTVYSTVTRWEGRIEVDSSPGEGATFTLHFPVWADAVVEEEGRETAVQPIRRGKVLIVDDDESICRLLARLLEERHEVEVVGDGRQALDLFAPGKYDAVMIDLGMSGMSGEELLKRMQEIDSLVAAVLITGWALPETDVRVIAFDFRLEKPFGDLDEVEDVVVRAIELHDERAQDNRRRQ